MICWRRKWAPWNWLLRRTPHSRAHAGVIARRQFLRPLKLCQFNSCPRTTRSNSSCSDMPVASHFPPGATALAPPSLYGRGLGVRFLRTEARHQRGRLRSDTSSAIGSRSPRAPATPVGGTASRDALRRSSRVHIHRPPSARRGRPSSPVRSPGSASSSSCWVRSAPCAEPRPQDAAALRASSPVRWRGCLRARRTRVRSVLLLVCARTLHSISPGGILWPHSRCLTRWMAGAVCSNAVRALIAALPPRGR